MAERLTIEDLIWIDELFERLTIDDAFNKTDKLDSSERPTQGKGANADIKGNGVYFMLGEDVLLVRSKALRNV